MSGRRVPVRSGLTAWESFLAFEIALAVLAAAFWWFGFSIYSPDAKAREQALLGIADADTLHRIATSDPDHAVRAAATGRIDDAGRLAAIAAADPFPDVRVAALRGIDDKAKLAQFALEDKATLVRREAVGRVQDPAVIARVATQDPDAEVRMAAVEKAADAVVLLRVALADKEASLREAALKRLSAQALAQASGRETDARRSAELSASAKILAALQQVPDQRRSSLAANLLLLAQGWNEPAWASRFGPLRTVEIVWSEGWRSYSGMQGVHTVNGENIQLRASFARSGAPLAARWQSEYPHQAPRSQTWVSARVDARDALVSWIAADAVTLERIAMEGDDPVLRLAAARKLVAKPALKRLAEQSTDPQIRQETTARLQRMR